MFPVAGKNGQDFSETHKYWEGVDIYSCLISSTEDLEDTPKTPRVISSNSSLNVNIRQFLSHKSQF